VPGTDPQRVRDAKGPKLLHGRRKRKRRERIKRRTMGRMKD
jgi:hypothetical protein